MRGKVWKLAIGNPLNLTHSLYDICVQRFVIVIDHCSYYGCIKIDIMVSLANTTVNSVIEQITVLPLFVFLLEQLVNIEQEQVMCSQNLQCKYQLTVTLRD